MQSNIYTTSGNITKLKHFPCKRRIFGV